jgi:uroporphyrinogen-III decarboxylase
MAARQGEKNQGRGTEGMKNILINLKRAEQVSKNCLKKSQTETQKEYFRGQLEAYADAINIIEKEMKIRKLMID